MTRLTAAIEWACDDYEAVCAAHRWVVPERLNVAVEACTRWADGSGRRALVEMTAGPSHEDSWNARAFSFDALEDMSNRLAGALRSAGVGQGDRVAVFLPQRVETMIAHLATLKLGAIGVPLSPLFRAQALELRLAASGSKALFTDRDGWQHVAPLRDRLPELRDVICCGTTPPGTESFTRLLEDSVPIETAADTHADDPAMLVFTSGTAGPPKGALHAHRFLPGRLSAFELIHQLEAMPSTNRPFWTPADWAWVGGLVDCVLTPWVFGCPVVAFRRTGFDAGQVFELLLRARVRSLFLPPTAVNLLRRQASLGEAYDFDLHSVHTAGEPLPADAWRWAEAVFGHVYELYGMTEMGALVGGSPYSPVKPGAIGRPYPGHDVVLLDDRGDPVEGEGEGEIAVARGDPGMFLGYWNDPEATAERFRGEFLVTGDYARRDEDGYLWYLGRRDDMFNTAGYRVGPTEIEEALHAHAAVARAAVIGEPDPDRGAVVKAFVLLATGIEPSDGLAEDLQDFVKQRLAAYAYPRRIVFVRELPLTVTGKVRRQELRESDAGERFGVKVGE
jgi:acetyl-CoA synthetase